MLEEKIISVCSMRTLWASSSHQPSCTPHLALVSSRSGNENLCAELWQYKCLPGKVFCQALAGASSSFTAAVKYISAPSPYSPSGTDWIDICGVGFFCTEVIFFLGFWALICETWNCLTSKLIPGLVRSISLQWTIFSLLYTWSSLQTAIIQQPAIFSCLSFMFSVGFEHLWKV